VTTTRIAAFAAGAIAAAMLCSDPALAGFGKGGKTDGGFKADPIYGGGRGRDPYGLPLDADPYHAGGPRDNIKFAPPNAGIHGDGKGRKGREERDEDYQPPERRRMNPEDQAEDNRANRAAQRASEEEDR